MLPTTDINSEKGTNIIDLVKQIEYEAEGRKVVKIRPENSEIIDYTPMKAMLEKDFKVISADDPAIKDDDRIPFVEDIFENFNSFVKNIAPLVSNLYDRDQEIPKAANDDVFSKETISYEPQFEIIRKSEPTTKDDKVVLLSNYRQDQTPKINHGYNPVQLFRGYHVDFHGNYRSNLEVRIDFYNQGSLDRNRFYYGRFG